LFLARFKLGMFDPPETVRWARTPYSGGRKFNFATVDTLLRNVRANSMRLVLLRFVRIKAVFCSNSKPSPDSLRR
jgi:hypothetical protein